MGALSQELQKAYLNRFHEIQVYRDEVWKAIIRHFMQKHVGHDKVVLDLGSGWAEFINNIQASQRYAMDLNPDARDRVNEGVTFLQQDCSHEWALPDNSLDVVFTSNFFEHLPSKECLLDTLRQAHRCLRKGGRLICLGPNLRYVGQAYWDFFDHYLPLTDRTLAEGLELADFTIESSIDRFMPFTMSDGKRPPIVAVQLYLKLPIAWRFFGKQFLITGVK